MTKIQSYTALLLIILVSQSCVVKSPTFSKVTAYGGKYPTINFENAHYNKRFRAGPALVVNYLVFPLFGALIAKQSGITTPGYGALAGFAIGSLLTVIPAVTLNNKTIPFDNVTKWGKKAHFVVNGSEEGYQLINFNPNNYRYAGHSINSENDIWFVHNNSWTDYEFTDPPTIMLFKNAFPEKDPTHIIQKIYNKYKSLIYNTYPIEIMQSLNTYYPKNLYTLKLWSDYDQKVKEDNMIRGTAALLVGRYLHGINTNWGEVRTPTQKELLLRKCIEIDRIEDFDKEKYKDKYIVKCKEVLNGKEKTRVITVNLNGVMNIINPLTEKPYKDYDDDKALKLITKQLCNCEL